jgi:hypothetical protein
MGQREVGMRSEKLFVVKLTIFVLTLLVFLPGFEVKKTNTALVQGTIESVDKDFKFITVNGTKFSLSSGAKIVDGFSAKGVAVTPPKKKP